MISKRTLRGGLLGAWVALGAGCGAEAPEPPVAEEPLGRTSETFEGFLRTVTRDRETGAWLVEGDLAFPTVERVREYWEQRPGRAGGLVVHQSGGVDVAWAGTDRTRLTYCVSQGGFGSAYGTVVQAMAQAANAWEAVAPVDFHHMAAQDGNCNELNHNVVFSVEYTSGQLYTASAFFPNFPRSDRRLMVDLYNATHSAPKTLTGILRHELGHALGFRHEHTRPESGCIENYNWRALTPYDSASVMHYPGYQANCGGTNTGDYVLTQWDRVGASALYGGVNRKNFNGDVHTDILWWQPSTGKLSAWMMNGATVMHDSLVSWTTTNAGGWEVKGTGDFNRDGHTDVLWHNGSTGVLSVWYLQGTTVIGNPSLSYTSLASTGWEVKGTGDFNLDGHTDILWHHGASGDLTVWMMQGTTRVADVRVSWKTATSTGWEVRGTGDFNRDGYVDLLWHHGASGSISVWYLQGTTVIGSPTVSWTTTTASGWSIQGTGDFNRDGEVDLLWYNPNTGKISVWFMQGPTVLSSTVMNWTTQGSTGWKIVSR
ncbi:MAG TPA: FG-GAP-like repeat-containing protein [Myxococcus sp.]|nr:FG-GAP-like repeat-containing protein [Myxococcus sp.]